MCAQSVAVSDAVADLLTRIRNASERFHSKVRLPSSRMKEEIARVLHEEGFIAGYEVERDGPQKTLVLELKYKGKRDKEPVIRGLQRVSRPSLRVYAGADEIPQVLGGLGVTIVSTSQGVMTGKEARHRHIGGEVLCQVW